LEFWNAEFFMVEGVDHVGTAGRRRGCDRTSARFATLSWEGEKIGVNKKRPLCHDWGTHYPGVIGMEAAGMKVAKDSDAFKSIQEITERAEALKQFVVQAATDGKSLYEIERGLLDQLLTIGNHAMNAALSLQGTGDLGAAYVTPKGRELRRSANPEPRKLRTIFGQHVFRQFVYSAGANRKIDLRPIDARLGLSPRVCSQLMEEFTQMFCVESAFRQAALNFDTVFRQKVSVDTLEAIARRMARRRNNMPTRCRARPSLRKVNCSSPRWTRKACR
jgi:hypothetical protein